MAPIVKEPNELVYEIDINVKGGEITVDKWKICLQNIF